jgi:hypothetical protein
MVPLSDKVTGILKGGNMYETPMLVELGSFADLTRRPKRGHRHDHRRRHRPHHGGYGD